MGKKTEEILRFENITVSYGERDVIRDFSCTVNRGEFVSLIGPNGSGKSTLIHAVTGIVEPKAGEIYVAGRNNKSMSARERAQITAVVPQNFHANFAFKAKEIVAMGRHPFLGRMQSESTEDYKIIDEALAETGTLHLRERKITQLSGGERQRIIISAALAQQPQLLILDEPTNHLDIQYTLEIMQLMRKLNREKGITIFAVLHDINMAARFSDRIVVLNQGEKVQEGPSREIISEDILKPVYKIDLVVRDNPLTGSAEIVPIRSNKGASRDENGRKIHVICGGGSGSMIIEALHNSGCEVTCGVLSMGDSDYELCRSLGIEVVEEKPYCDIGIEAFQANLKAIKASDAVVLCGLDVGQSNLANVEILEHAGDREILVVEGEGQDYTGGKATAVVDSLIAKGDARRIEKDALLDAVLKEK